MVIQTLPSEACSSAWQPFSDQMEKGTCAGIHKIKETQHVYI